MEENKLKTIEGDLEAPADFTSPDVLYRDLVASIRKYHPSDDLSMIEKAYQLADNAHKDQKRKSGEPYIIHPLCVAIILADLEMDKETIAAGLLHDVVEDTVYTEEQLAELFGKEVALLVDGVTKLTQLSWSADKVEMQAENLRKMFLAMAKDIRVIIIKLADRLHNMRTLQYMRPEKQKEKARETIEIYSPLADRLGISKIKIELDDLALRYLEPNVYKELEEKEQSLQKQVKMVQEELDQTQGELARLGSRIGELSGENESRRQQLEEKLQGYVPNEALEQEVWELLKKQSGQAVINRKKAQVADLEEKEQAQAETLRAARNRYIFAYPAGPFNGAETSNEAYEKLLEKYLTDFEPAYEEEFEKKCASIYKSLRENVIATIHGDIKAAKRHAYEINRLLRETNFSDSTYQIKIEPAKNENGQFFDMLMAEELDSKNLDNAGIDGQISFGEDAFYQKYEQKIKLLTDKFMPPKDEDEHLRAQKRKEMEQYADYRNYLSFSMFEQVTDEHGNVIRENFVDDMAGRDSGGEGQNPKYVALLAGFAMLYMQQSKRDSKIKLVLLDEAFSKMDQERSAVCLKYARKMDLQLIVCVPDERLQSLIRNVDCVYGFRRFKNRISMMHIDKGQYLEMMEG